MEEILILATAIAIVVGGVVEAVKRATNVNKRYLPIVAMIVGALVGVLQLISLMQKWVIGSGLAVLQV